tara:strand:- start:3978 stop:5150 length:1173 start_codon:yes stop_codon:yes gene_type:complete
MNNINNYIPLSVPTIKGNEWSYIKECLDTEWVSSAGKYVELFEEKISSYTGSKFAVACVNGTSALQISLKLAGVEPEHEVIVPSITFIAPVNAVHYNRAMPIFMDSDDYFNIDVEKTIEFIKLETKFKQGKTYNNKTGKIISAIIPVHIFGNGVNLDLLYQICKERNIKIIEDASESIGTVYSEGFFSGKHTGTIGDFGCLSFNGNKIITSGGGGMILTNDEELAKQAKYITSQAKDDPIKFIHNEVGYNFRLTNIQAALGVAQLEQLPNFLKVKKEINRYYFKKIKDISGISLCETPAYANNNFWLNLIKIDPKILNKDINSIINDLARNNIESRPVWHPNHLQQQYKNCQNYKVNNSLKLVSNSLCIPSSIKLNNNDLIRIISVLKSL